MIVSNLASFIYNMGDCDGSANSIDQGTIHATIHECIYIKTKRGRVAAYLQVLQPSLDFGANLRGFFLQAWLPALAAWSFGLVIATARVAQE